MADEFPDLESIQRFLANSFTISVVRKMGPTGTLDCVREFLKKINLAAIRPPSTFPQTLDELTEKLCRAMPKDAQHWGVARKCMNLFFRDSLYNFYLRQRYSLAELEDDLEIPLDSFVGKALKHEDEGAELPRWHSVVSLTKEHNVRFQTVALLVARRRRTKRVHLDLIYWRGQKTPQRQPLPCPSPISPKNSG